jgi:hypothetical protein
MGNPGRAGNERLAALTALPGRLSRPPSVGAQVFLMPTGVR